jgi:type VI secretion system protein VasG
MVPVDLKSLVSKVNPTCRRALEGAAGLCMSRTHYNIEIEHWLAKLLEFPQTDVPVILRSFDVNLRQFEADLTRSLDRLKLGNARQPAISPDLVHLVREAWLLASITFGDAAVRSGYMLAALLSDESLVRLAREMSPELEAINGQTLLHDLPKILEASEESHQTRQDGGGEAGPMGQKNLRTDSPSLQQFTIDLTARAREGHIDPVIGRDDEIRQMIDILTRRRQNNPILTGEAGVGKTAVVEGFALRIAAGDVPESLKTTVVRTLDLGLLQAGAGVKGEFENRLKSVIEEVKASPQPIILFIDEAHTMIGAGGQAGQGDAANLLKPALARGELRTIAATTWAEYKQYFERDAALARRFQVVKIDQPSETNAFRMIRSLVSTLESHHKVRILDNAVTDAVKLSNRYISGRMLPDKAVSLLDTACARVALGQSTIPPALEHHQREKEGLEIEIQILEREQSTGANHAEALKELTQQLEHNLKRLEELQVRWKQESALVMRIRELRETIEAGQAENLAELRNELDSKIAELAELQGETPLMQTCVDTQTIADVVSAWTGIPVGRMVSDEIRSVLDLKERMEENVVGQSQGLEAIAQRIKTSRAKLNNPGSPIGVFLLAGPSGVGKTETALTLANLLYGGEQNLTTINMSEFKEEFKVSQLLGPPPGYKGFEAGGVLTEAVRRRPYSVVLLDELEKAHESVQEIFYQVFDKGMLRDGQGRDVDFKNTLIIMTSNAGAEVVNGLCADPETMPSMEDLSNSLYNELLQKSQFKPAFLGRVTLVPYLPLSEEVLCRIVELKLGKVARRVAENYGAKLDYAPEVVGSILKRCREVETGARSVDHIVTGTLLPQLATEFLSRLAEGKTIRSVTVILAEDGRFDYEIQ